MNAAPILVVDDNDLMCLLLTGALEDDGYRVQCARSASEALACLAGAEVVSVVISDALTWPSAPYAWLDQLRAATPAPIIICSAYAAERYADHQRRGFAAFVAKPFDLDQLARLVTELTSAPGPLPPAPALVGAHGTIRAGDSM